MLANGCLALPLAAVAQSPDFERIAPQSVPQSSEGDIAAPEAAQALQSGRDRVLVDALEGLMFVDSPDLVAAVTNNNGINIDLDVEFRQEEFAHVFEPFLGRPLSLALLDQINQETVNFFRERDYPVVDAFAPDGQDISDGVVQIVVLVGRLGAVRVEGARFSDSEKLQNTIRLENNNPIVLSTLQEDIRWLNRNPFRTVNALFERGDAFSQTDLVLSVEERVPVRVYASTDDTGNALTGEERLNAGINWGNAFGLGHQLGYQYSTSFENSEFSAHSINYQAPLPWRHNFSLFGAYVESDPAPTTAGFDFDARSWQIGARYNLPVSLFSGLEENLSLGADFKHSNNNLQFGILDVLDTYTDILQFNLRWSAVRLDDYGSTEIAASVTLSPGGITVDNDDDKFSAARAGAMADYIYTRFDINRLTRLPGDATLATNLHIQLSDSNLLGSEQLGVGGYLTARGYDEYAATGDEGITLRNELRLAPMQVFSSEQRQDSLQFLSFVDYAYVKNVDLLPGETSTDLLSAGLGLRYAFGSAVSLRADYGWQLKEITPGMGKDSRIHFSLTVAY